MTTTIPLFRSSSSFVSMKDNRIKAQSQIDIRSPSIHTINSMPCSPLGIYHNDSQESQESDSVSSSDYASAQSSPSTTPIEFEQKEYFPNLEFSPEQLESLHRWCFAFCVVRFDLETGQAMDQIYPPYPFTENEQNNICFSAFPDTRVFESGDMVYQFRIRQANNVNQANSDGFYYGYTYFKQKRDSRIRRGYYQKSLVLISPLPFSTTVGLFTSVIQSVGAKYFELDYKQTDPNGNSANMYLDSVLRNIVQWPNPEFAKSLELPLSGKVLRVEMPESSKPSLQLLETSQLATNSSEVSGHLELDVPIMASVPDVGSPGLLFHWWDKLEELWSIWELMLLGEPLVVMGPDPSTCSQVITELLDLIKPIPYCGDYRPYITIQDPDFKSFASKNRVPPNTIIGVTNPHFSDALAHWPHWIQVGTGQPAVSSGSTRHRHRHRANHSSPFAAFNTTSRSTTPNGGLKQGIYTSRKSCLTQDSAAIRNLTSALLQGGRSATFLNNRLRRYFGELTQKFLLPFNRYMTTLFPNLNQSSLNGPMPIMKPFKPDDFLKSLTSQGMGLGTSKSDWNIDLYKQFLRSGNFATWLHQTLESSELQLKLRYIQHLCAVDVYTWAQKKQEIEIVDVIMKLKERLDEIKKSPYHNHSTPNCTSSCVTQLQNQLDKLISLLPNDLQGFL